MDAALFVSIAVVAVWVAAVWWSTPDRIERRRERRWHNTRPPS